MKKDKVPCMSTSMAVVGLDSRLSSSSLSDSSSSWMSMSESSLPSRNTVGQKKRGAVAPSLLINQSLSNKGLVQVICTSQPFF